MGAITINGAMCRYVFTELMDGEISTRGGFDVNTFRVHQGTMSNSTAAYNVNTNTLVNWGMHVTYDTEILSDTQLRVKLSAKGKSNASASGTATWFAWARYYYGNGGYDNMRGFKGSIDTLGTGADIEAKSTAITSGQEYAFQDFTIQFPTSFTG